MNKTLYLALIALVVVILSAGRVYAEPKQQELDCETARMMRDLSFELGGNYALPKACQAKKPAPRAVIRLQGGGGGTVRVYGPGEL